MQSVNDKPAIFPILHGSAACTMAFRRHLQDHRYTNILLPWPASLQNPLREICAELSAVHALVLETPTETAYLPADPCDPFIECIRQSLADTRTRLEFIAPDRIPTARDANGLPDPWVLDGLDMTSWLLAHIPFLAERPPAETPSWYAQVAKAALGFAQQGPTLLICHLGDYHALQEAWRMLANPATAHIGTDIDEDPATDAPMRIHAFPVHEKHLAFALQEIPFYAAYCERNRMDPFALLPTGAELLKSLLVAVRDQLEADGTEMRIPVGKLSTCLRYLQRLVRQNGTLSPALYPLAVATKGVLGDTFASRLLRYAQSYPFQSIGGNTLRIGPETLRRPWDGSPVVARNILRDRTLQWKRLTLRREPDWQEIKRYQRSWQPGEACSHVPEDIKLERFNEEARRQAMRLRFGKRCQSEPFTASLQDGIDLRETLRNWHEKRLYVRNEPPRRGRMDTVVCIFDTTHDERYPLCCTWYAEHDQESTLSFYGTDPTHHLVGPGIGRGYYGGFSLVFPPIHFPDLFHSALPIPKGLRLHEHLTYGTLLFSQEPLVAYVAQDPPGLRLQELARRLGKTLVHVPLREAVGAGIDRLRTYHMLNGKEIRSIARRFIGY